MNEDSRKTPETAVVPGSGPRADRRPWGYFVVLSDESDHKVKRIVVHPGKRLSLQRHRFRSEHWHVIRGEALVTRNRDEIPCRGGESVDIPLGAIHRIENRGESDLVFIEVQRGTYFGEDDIERFEDDFGRV
jgi:mannose-6-phosphate isomerase